MQQSFVMHAVKHTAVQICKEWMCIPNITRYKKNVLFYSKCSTVRLLPQKLSRIKQKHSSGCHSSEAGGRAKQAYRQARVQTEVAVSQMQRKLQNNQNRAEISREIQTGLKQAEHTRTKTEQKLAGRECVNRWDTSGQSGKTKTGNKA